MRALTVRNRELYVHVSAMIDRFGERLPRRVSAVARWQRAGAGPLFTSENPRWLHADRVYREVYGNPNDPTA